MTYRAVLHSHFIFLEALLLEPLEEGASVALLVSPFHVSLGTDWAPPAFHGYILPFLGSFPHFVGIHPPATF